MKAKRVLKVTLAIFLVVTLLTGCTSVLQGVVNNAQKGLDALTGRQADPTPEPVKAVLPDFGAFSGIDLEPRSIDTCYFDVRTQDGEVDVWKDVKEYHYLFDENEEFMEEYLDLLEEYGFDLLDYDESEGSSDKVKKEYSFFYSRPGGATFDMGESNQNMSLYLDWTSQSGASSLLLYFPTVFDYEDTGERTGAEVTVDGLNDDDDYDDDYDEPEPTPEPTPELSGPVVPDLAAFSGIDLDVYKARVHSEGTELTYVIDTNEKFVEEYLDLLEDYGFVLRDEYKGYRFTFDYTGSGGGTFDLDNDDVDGDDIALYFLSLDADELHVYYADGFDYVDTGDRANVKVTSKYTGGSGGSDKDSGGGGGGVPDSGPGLNQTRCSYCGGSGKRDCLTCGGDGEETITVTVPHYSGLGGKGGTSTEHKKCSSCWGRGKKDCNFCGGDGFR